MGNLLDDILENLYYLNTHHDGNQIVRTKRRIENIAFATLRSEIAQETGNLI